MKRRVACYTLPHNVVMRAKMMYAAEGESTAEIARRLETAPRVVNRWRKRFFEERLGETTKSEKLAICFRRRVCGSMVMRR